MKKSKETKKNIIVEVINEGTKRNPIYKANISSENKKKYFKTFDEFGNPIFIFHINNEIYITGNYILLFIWQHMSQKSARIFDKDNKNSLGVYRNEYLKIKIQKFKDESFVWNFIDENEKNDALSKGFPIVYKSKDNSFQSEFGFYYGDELDLVKYNALKRQHLLSKKNEIIIEKSTRKKFNFEI